MLALAFRPISVNLAATVAARQHCCVHTECCLRYADPYESSCIKSTLYVSLIVTTCECAHAGRAPIVIPVFAPAPPQSTDSQRAIISVGRSLNEALLSDAGLYVAEWSKNVSQEVCITWCAPIMM